MMNCIIKVGEKMDTIKFNSGNAKVIAHRGLSGIEKENTCPAFVAAGNRSYFGIETDIHVTKDGQLVVFHDDTTKRASLGTVNVAVEKTDYSVLNKIILPDTDGSFVRQDIKIPLLKDYISICKKYNKIAVLEIKNPFTFENLSKVIEEIKSLDYLDSVIFISFVLDNCINLRKILPKAQIQYLLDGRVTDKIISILALNNFGLDIRYTKLNIEDINKLHSLGIEINCWTCDDKQSAEELALMGIDYITTNVLE